jgi:iron(III) transport system permease protein
MSYGIYLYMQSVAGRGPGAALGVLAIAVVAVGTYLSHRGGRTHASALRCARSDEDLPPLPAVAAPGTSA